MAKSSLQVFAGSLFQAPPRLRLSVAVAVGPSPDSASAGVARESLYRQLSTALSARLAVSAKLSVVLRGVVQTQLRPLWARRDPVEPSSRDRHVRHPAETAIIIL